MTAMPQILGAIARHAPYECVTAARLAALTGLPRDTLDSVTQALVGRRLLRVTGKGCYQLTSGGRATAAELERAPVRTVRSQIYDRIWTALRLGFQADRLGRKLTVGDLVLAIADGGEKSIEGRIRSYVGALIRSGYVVRMRGARPARYQLLRDTGPLAPVWSDTRENERVHDPNIDRDIPIQARRAG
jgi:hypothetical protein